jgi:hypothetical protein
MNFKLLFAVFLFTLSLLAPVFAGGKDDGTIIIGEGGQILYKGGGKVSLKTLIESLQITLTIDTYERTRIRLSSRGGDAASPDSSKHNSTYDPAQFRMDTSL